MYTRGKSYIVYFVSVSHECDIFLNHFAIDSYGNGVCVCVSAFHIAAIAVINITRFLEEIVENFNLYFIAPKDFLFVDMEIMQIFLSSCCLHSTHSSIYSVLLESKTIIFSLCQSIVLTLSATKKNLCEHKTHVEWNEQKTRRKTWKKLQEKK